MFTWKNTNTLELKKGVSDSNKNITVALTGAANYQLNYTKGYDSAGVQKEKEGA